MQDTSFLSEPLQNKYKAIATKFRSVESAWKKYSDEIIPEDKELAKEIVQFVKEVIEYAIETEKFEEIKEFFINYKYQFYYGPLGDDYTYLAFDETTVDGYFLAILEPISVDDDQPAKESDFKNVKEKLERLLAEFN